MPSVPLARKLSSPVLVQQAASDQLTLHLAKLLTDLPSLGSARTPPLKLVLGELPMTKVCCRDPRSTFFGLCTSAGPAMQPAPPVLLMSRTLARGPPTGLRTTSLPRPIRPKPPLDTDGHIVFYQHEYHPAYEVLLYRKLGGASRRAEPSCRRKFSVSEKCVGKYVDTDCCFWGQNLNLAAF